MPKIDELLAAGALTGAERIPLEQGAGDASRTRRVTLDEALARAQFTSPATGAASRSVASKLAEAPSVRDFGAVGDGVADDKAAFIAARDSIPSGGVGEIAVPKGAAGYLLSSPAFGPNGRNVEWKFEDGANIQGGITSRINGATWRFSARPSGARWDYTKGVVDEAVGRATHEFVQVENVGPTTGYGRRYGYVGRGYGAGTYDLAEASICRWEREAGQTGGSGMTEWRVAISPTLDEAGTFWSTLVGEWNVVNRGPDTGWGKRRSVFERWTGGVQVVPEGQDFGSGGVPKNVLFGIGFMNAPVASPAGYRPRLYNGLMGEPNSIHEAGRAIYWSGSDGTGGTGGGAPVAFAELDDGWQWGLKTNRAAFANQPIGLGVGQSIGWIDGADALVGGLSVEANGAIILGVGGSARNVARKRVWSAGQFAVAGDRQRGEHMLWRTTANPVAVKLTSDGGPATTLNQVVLPNSSTYAFTGVVVLRAGALAAKFTVEGLIRRGANAAATVLVGSSAAMDYGDTGTEDWVVALAADTTNGALAVSITGTGSIAALADITTQELAI